MSLNSKKQKIILLSISLGLLLPFVFIFASNAASRSAKSEQVVYSLTLNSSKNRFNDTTGSEVSSGSAIVKTNRGTDIAFEYSDLMGGNNTWHIVKANGYFYNTTPINGISSISLNFKTAEKPFKIYWSQTTSFTEDASVELTSSNTDPINFDFNSSYPSYFKVENVSANNINISEILLNFTCVPQNKFSVNVTSEDESMGTVSGSGSYKYGSNVTVAASMNTGVAFVGWFDLNDSLVSTNPSFTFTMPDQTVNLVARFEYIQYALNVTSNDESMGTVSGSGSFRYNEEVTVVAIANPTYGFIGWFENDVLVNDEPSYTFTMPSHTVSLVAKFAVFYSITLISDDESMGTVSGPSLAPVGREITVTATCINGCSFEYWCDGDYNELSYDESYTFTMPSYEIELHAVFKAGFDLVVTSSNTEKGSVTGSGLIRAGESVTITATPNTGVSFSGWYEGDVLVSTSSTYTFTMPNRQLTYEGRFEDIIYTLKFITNGGSAISDIKQAYNTTLPTIKTTRNGYTFAGWYKNSALTQAYTLPSKMPAQNLTLYAKWTQIEYTVTISGDAYVFDDDTSPSIWIESKGGMKYSVKGNTTSFKQKSGTTFVIDSSYGHRKYYVNNKDVTPSNNSRYTVSIPLNKTKVTVVLNANTSYATCNVTY